jgi:hypothetical protein
LKLNTRAYGDGGAPMWCISPMWWCCGQTLGGVGGISLNLCDLRYGRLVLDPVLHDMWVGDKTLKETIPMLFTFACFKEASVANHIQFLNYTCQWNVTFIRVGHLILRPLVLHWVETRRK